MRTTPPSHPTTPSKQEIPGDLKCSICLEVPLRPMITPCDHLFCDTCIQRALISQDSCPNCRSPCGLFDTRRLKNGSLLHRVWGGIKVNCSNHDGACPWKGSISDYMKHTEECELQHMHRKVEILNTRTEFLETRIANLKSTNMELKMEINGLEKQNVSVISHNKILQKALMESAGVKTVPSSSANIKRRVSTEVSAKKRRKKWSWVID